MDEDKTQNTLIKIGMPIGLKGFKYITDAISLLDKPEWKNPKWTALYYAVAKLNNTTSYLVESGIRNALKSTRERNCDYKSIEHYIGFANCENSNSLNLLYTRLKQEECKQKTNDSVFAFKTALRELLKEANSF